MLKRILSLFLPLTFGGFFLAPTQSVEANRNLGRCLTRTTIHYRARERKCSQRRLSSYRRSKCRQRAKVWYVHQQTLCRKRHGGGVGPVVPGGNPHARELARLRREVSDLKSQVKSLESQVRTKNQEIESKNRDITNKNREIASKNKTISNKDRELRTLTTRMNGIRCQKIVPR